jgi:hypothetical protein
MRTRPLLPERRHAADADKATGSRSGGKVTLGLTSYFSVVRRILEKLGPLKWLAFVVCLVVFGFGAFTAKLEDANRYTEIREADWIPTNMWLKSAECARLRRVWLAICDDDKLVPISEHSFGDDPGHALFLGMWAMATGDTVSLDDVARLNFGLNAAGFIILASFLFAIRAYVTSIVLLMVGPAIYLGWIGVSPHWSFIGITSMVLVLPMALIAKEYGFQSRWSGNAYVAVGILGLSVAALVREPIGVMGFVTSIGVIGALVVRRLRSRSRLRSLFVIGSLVFVASAASTWVVLARDVSFEMATAQRVTTHNFSHTLYIGLGAVPNGFGISYDDDVARTSVERVAPDVVYCSPEYYRVLWKLYWSKIAHAPVEVVRIYFEKAKLILADRILDTAPPLGFVLIFTVTHFVVVTAFRVWGRIDFSQGLLVEGAAIILIGLFVAQAILAHPNRMYAMPVGGALLVLLGAMLEFCCRSTVILLAQIRTKEAVERIRDRVALPSADNAKAQTRSIDTRARQKAGDSRLFHPNG